MYYTIVKSFSKNDANWKGYLKWRKLNINRFDSLDGSLRPTLFHPESASDWMNCVNEENKTHYITTKKYALSILKKYDNPVLVGIDFVSSSDYKQKDNFLGFDIVDIKDKISIITNWGDDKDNIMNQYIMENGLVKNINEIFQIYYLLQEKFPNDSHIKNSEIIAIYNRGAFLK